MMDFTQFSALQEKLTSAQTTYIFLPVEPQLDQVAAGLGLYLSLSKAGKAATIASPEPMVVGFSPLVGVDKIGQKLPGRNLVVSFDYVEDSIEKVSYNIENGKFNLVVQSKEGVPPLSTANVQYSYTGGLQGLVITIEIADLTSLGHLYQDNKELFAVGNVYDFDKQGVTCLCEKVAGLISYTKLPIDQDIATNLVLGIEEATKNFTHPSADADTFEAMAFCLRAGGKRATTGQMEQLGQKSPRLKAGKKQPMAPPSLEDLSAKPPSSDWLQPKIYKGNTRI